MASVMKQFQESAKRLDELSNQFHDQMARFAAEGWSGKAADQAMISNTKAREVGTKTADTSKSFGGTVGDFGTSMSSARDKISAMPVSDPSIVDAMKTSSAFGGISPIALLGGTAANYWAQRQQAENERKAILAEVQKMGNDASSYGSKIAIFLEDIESGPANEPPASLEAIAHPASPSGPAEILGDGTMFFRSEGGAPVASLGGAGSHHATGVGNVSTRAGSSASTAGSGGVGATSPWGTQGAGAIPDNGGSFGSAGWAPSSNADGVSGSGSVAGSSGEVSGGVTRHGNAGAIAAVGGAAAIGAGGVAAGWSSAGGAASGAGGWAANQGIGARGVPGSIGSAPVGEGMTRGGLGRGAFGGEPSPGNTGTNARGAGFGRPGGGGAMSEGARFQSVTESGGRATGGSNAPMGGRGANRDEEQELKHRPEYLLPTDELWGAPQWAAPAVLGDELLDDND
ncbi:hypothetical protein [Austwickia sp. TVS 96-490-7B]|uniref:hypothetical protein n=1 Tax=Austwickia sp. TVS 96-490-7B TaxID=2830843 RepID=UPI001C575DE3|nr:hypothetical protein [Austwickia sp. TVS 96-490-7B]